MAKICQSNVPSKALGSASSQSPDRALGAPFRFRWASALGLFLLTCMTGSACHAQSRNVLCRGGSGYFEAEYPTGVKVHVGPSKIGELETRVCEAALSWGDQNLVVSEAAMDLDIDAFGVDLGLGVPVVAAQVRRSKSECCMEYKIYSLHDPPMLLRSIAGGEFFSSADTDLDGRVEIWTNDAASLQGFENLRLRDLDFAPPMVLRFVRGRLLDASSEFQSYFDQKIADERAMLNAQDLGDFKSSDGKLAVAAAMPADQFLRLRSVKVKVLEIAWSYLYSGREQEAWRSLAEMWPAPDFDRIRAALLNARAHGIRSQVDGVSTPIPPSRQAHAKIFDGTTTVMPLTGVTPKDVKPKQEIIPPRVILMERPAPATPVEEELAQSESLLKLVIDAAGKVRSVEQMGNEERIDQSLLKSTSNWKFIPAYNAGEPVASQIFLGVSLRR